MTVRFSFHDVTIDDVSVVDAQLDAATIYTINQDYDVSTNRLATEADLPDISGKQDTLVSGTNIKTINNESILGSGNITISGGGSDTDVVHYDSTGTSTTEATLLDNYYTKTQTIDFSSMTTLYSTTSVSTGTKTLSDSLANYKLLIIGFYNNNSAGWNFQTIPKILFDTLNSSSNLLWIVAGNTGEDRRIALYKYSNTQVYLYNVDNAHRVAIYGLK